MTEQQWNIYVLIDPRWNEVFYVGRTKNPKKRLAAHISDAIKAGRRSTHKNNRLRQLIIQGFTPVLEIVEIGTGDSAEAECRWIAKMRSDGITLLNLTDGGEGVPGLVRGPRTPEHTANLSAALKRAMTPERRARLSAALQEYNRGPFSVEYRGPLSSEHRQKTAVALRGNTNSSDTHLVRMREKATWRNWSRRKQLANSGFNWNQIKQQWNS